MAADDDKGGVDEWDGVDVEDDDEDDDEDEDGARVGEVDALGPSTPDVPALVPWSDAEAVGGLGGGGGGTSSSPPPPASVIGADDATSAVVNDDDDEDDDDVVVDVASTAVTR